MNWDWGRGGTQLANRPGPTHALIEESEQVACQRGSPAGPWNADRASNFVAFTFFALYVLILVLGLLVWAGVIGLAMGLSLVVAAALIAITVGALGKLAGF